MQYKEDISWNLLDLVRTKAIVVIDGIAYESDNHQDAMLEYSKDYWKKQNISLDFAFGDAIAHTDQLFRENRIFGFDVFEDPISEKPPKYLISHYPQHLQEKSCRKWAQSYAADHEMELATFTNEDKLGDKCCLLTF